MLIEQWLPVYIRYGMLSNRSMKPLILHIRNTYQVFVLTWVIRNLQDFVNSCKWSGYEFWTFALLSSFKVSLNVLNPAFYWSPMFHSPSHPWPVAPWKICCVYMDIIQLGKFRAQTSPCVYMFMGNRSQTSAWDWMRSIFSSWCHEEEANGIMWKSECMIKTNHVKLARKTHFT